MPWMWGSLDCATFATGMVNLIRKKDHALGFDYDDEHGAMEYVAKQGGLDQIATRALGLPVEVPWWTKDGDIVLAELENGPTLGVATSSNQKAHFKTARYLSTIPLDDCLLYWGV